MRRDEFKFQSRVAIHVCAKAIRKRYESISSLSSGYGLNFSVDWALEPWVANTLGERERKYWIPNCGEGNGGNYSNI